MSVPSVNELDNDLSNDYSAWDDDLALNTLNLEPIQLTVDETASGKRLDAALGLLLPDFSRSRMQKWLKDGAVMYNGVVETSPRRIVYVHDVLNVQPQASDEMKAYTAQEVPLDIVYEDDDILVLNKPAGLVVHPGSGNWEGTLLNGLLFAYPDISQVPRAGIVHRLDKDTSGVMLFSHNRTTRGAYQSLFQSRAVTKVYEAIAPTRVDYDYPLRVASRMVRGEQFYLTQEVEGEPNAFTTIELIENRGVYSLYRLHPETGKKHQLRVHMMRLGMPLLNDGLYPIPTPIDVVDYDKPLKLLARRIEFIDPITGTSRSFESELSLSLPD